MNITVGFAYCMEYRTIERIAAQYRKQATKVRAQVAEIQDRLPTGSLPNDSDRDELAATKERLERCERSLQISLEHLASYSLRSFRG